MRGLPVETRRWPWLLLATMLLQAAWMTWLLAGNAVRVTSDAVCFKQPAYMRLHTDHFSIPTYAGKAPHIDKLNSYPAAVYFHVNYVVFAVCGFSLRSSVGVDLVVHLLLACLAAWALWKLTNHQLPAVVLLLASSQFILPLGRPEELGMLAALVGLLLVERGRWGYRAAILALGLTGATTPGSAVVGTVLIVGYDAFLRGSSRTTLLRAVGLFILPPLISLGLYAWYAWPFLNEAVEQHRALSEGGFYVRASLLSQAGDDKLWAISVLPMLGAALIFGGYCLWRKPTWFCWRSPMGAFVGAATVAIAVGLCVNIATMRLEYDYRHVTFLAIAMLATGISWLPAAPGKTRPTAIVAYACLVVFGLPVQQLLVRYTLAPLAGRGQTVSYDDSLKLLKEAIPPNASIGGGGSVWTMVDDGRPYISTMAASIDHWPEYLISDSWATNPTFAQDSAGAAKLAKEYEEVTPTPHLAVDGCSLHIGPLAVPIARGRCDWYVRIWRRRDAP